MLNQHPLAIHLWGSFVIRLACIYCGQRHDKTMLVKYTDIDYQVFSDAARHVYNGQSPYLRHTYRYTPFLAFMLVPNNIISPLWGKVLFSLADMYVGILIWKILRSQGFGRKTAHCFSLAWLYNPFTVAISTRGSAEAILCMLVLKTVLCLQKNEVLTGGLIYGFSVHFKIYPFIYMCTFITNLLTPGFGFHNVRNIYRHNRMWKFIFASSVGAILPTVVSLCLYGDVFLKEAYLYHLIRKDFRHNFSPFFYFLYLSQPQDLSLSCLTYLLSFLPFLLIVVLLPFALLYKSRFVFHNLNTSPGHVVLCLFTQTFLFVSFNKVCTSQYFLWYLPLLLVLMPHLRMSMARFSVLTFLWSLGQAVWLFLAYQLEFRGLNTFPLLWLASLSFLLTNVFTASQFIRHASPLPRPIPTHA